MAIKYTDNIYITSARLADGYVEAWLESETDTTATIGWKIGCRQKSAALYGQEAYGYVDGSYVGYTSGYITSSSSSWKEVCSKSGTTKVNKTASSRSVPVTVKTRVTPIDGYGSVTTDYESATVYVSVKAITYYAPNAPSGLTNTRESDNKNVLAWTKPSTSTTKPVTAQLIERSVDGGSWSQIASVSGTATSYNDTTTSADHSYAYRIRSQNSAGYSDYVTSGTTYNTPSAPTKVTASRLAETTVKLEIANAANTATAMEIQRSTDAAAWETVSTVDGSPVTETTDEPGGGTFYYRARNTRGDLVSEWSPSSNAVMTICAPAAPTLKAPASGVVVNKAIEQIVFEWLHNAIDGSAQTAAKLRYSLDKGATWVEVAIDGTAASYALENAFAVNSEVTWSVCTKGAHADYGPWSDNRVFYVYQAPSVAFAQPTDGFVVENTPIAIQLQYDDPSGTLASAILTVYDGAKPVYALNMGTDTSCEIQNTEWTPDNGKVYTLTIAVRSSSSLTASATREISVNFVLPQPAAVHIENYPETGYASLVVYVEESEDLEVPKSISVWRESDDGRVLLGERLQAGAGLIDRYAPLNADYQYIVTSFADSGAANSQEFANRINSLWWFVYFDGGMAKAMWEPSGSRSSRRTKDELKERDGSEWPVLIQGKNKSHKVDFSGWVETKEEADAFEDMTLASGGKVYKGLKGEVFHCHAESDITDSYEYGDDSADVKVSITRVRGGAL